MREFRTSPAGGPPSDRRRSPKISDRLAVHEEDAVLLIQRHQPEVQAVQEQLGQIALCRNRQTLGHSLPRQYVLPPMDSPA